ncbi:MAG: META domain-containing protein [Muribaculaceae bacterium]|nr:META domain-containing protein [Muribaculaceae bacterium]
MNTKTLILSMAAAALMASSCSVFKGSQSGNSSSRSEIKSETVKPDKSAGKKDKKDKKNKNRAASQVSSTENVKPTREQLCGGEWTVSSVGDVNITVEENVPYVNFAPDGRFYASDGCNTINGDYALRSDGTLTFDHVLSTMKYCADMEYSALIASMFGPEKVAVDCRRIGQDTYLYFKNKNGNTIMTLRRHNMEFLNGNWRVTAIDGRAIDDEEANIFIDIAELKVHGNTGCNFFNGDLYIDTTRSNAIDFSNMGLTRMACPKGDQERMMMVALEETKTAIAGKNDDTVLLLNGKGKEVLTLRRIPVEGLDQ